MKLFGKKPQTEDSPGDWVPLGDVRPRERTRTGGTVRRVHTRPTGGIPSLEVTLSDGTSSVTAVWTGRHRIGGVHVGRLLVVEGVPSGSSKGPVFTNPEYELR